MDKILKTYKDIVVGTRVKSIKILSLSIIVVVLIISFSFITIKMFNRALLNTVILDYDGYVRNPNYIHPDSANIIKCQAFIDDFCNHFFAFTPTNLQHNLEYSLELGDNSVKNAYKSFMSRNWYNDIVQYNLEQRVFISTINVKIANDVYKIYTEAYITLMDISDAGQQIRYKLKFSCLAKPIKPSYPKFKQGLFITKFNYDLKED